MKIMRIYFDIQLSEWYFLFGINYNSYCKRLIITFLCFGLIIDFMRV